MNVQSTFSRFKIQFHPLESESSEFRTRMKELLVIFPDTLTVALTATIQINAQNIHAYAYELKGNLRPKCRFNLPK